MVDVVAGGARLGMLGQLLSATDDFSSEKPVLELNMTVNEELMTKDVRVCCAYRVELLCTKSLLFGAQKPGCANINMYIVACVVSQTTASMLCSVRMRCHPLRFVVLIRV